MLRLEKPRRLFQQIALLLFIFTISGCTQSQRNSNVRKIVCRGIDESWRTPAYATAVNHPDCRQAVVILAPPEKHQGTGHFIERDPNGQWEHRALFPIAVGKAGIAPRGEKREGDKRTPAGIFTLTESFGRATPANAGTKLEYRQATKNDAWSEDPDSPYYNQWLSGDRAKAATDRLLRDDGLYDQAIVVDYNRDPAIPGRGSAIFIHRTHADGSGTLGCIGLEAADLDYIFRTLDPAQQPVVVISLEVEPSSKMESSQ